MLYWRFGTVPRMETTSWHHAPASKVDQFIPSTHTLWAMQNGRPGYVVLPKGEEPEPAETGYSTVMAALRAKDVI